MKKLVLTIALFSMVVVSSNLNIAKDETIDFNASSGVRYSDDLINEVSDGDISPYKAITPAPDPTWPSTPDKSDKTTSFEDAIEISLDGYYGEYFQSDTDYDYYVYYADYTNYIRFNVESLNSLYKCNINVYRSDDLEEPIYCYTNTSTRTGSNIDTIEPIYAYQGEVYYFEIYLIIPEIVGVVGLASSTADIGYSAKVISANETDCDPSEYESNGYVLSRKFIYNGSDNIYCYFYDILDTCVTSDYSYKDALNEAISIWNSVGIKQFVVTDSESSADIVFYTTFNDIENFAGRTTETDYDKNYVYKAEVKFNSYYLENVYNKYSKTYHEALLLNVAIHELGHCLGINDLETEGNIMYGTNTTLCNLGQWDIAIYRYLWG